MILQVWILVVVRSLLETFRKKLLILLGGLIAMFLAKDTNILERCEEEDEDI